jgi:hypothetical protein
MPEHDPNLVPGRSCGECTVCCEALWIDEPELKKQPGVCCLHCSSGQGCQIYAVRPPICRNWHCEWRKIATLGPEWRPDRSGILIGETSTNIPPQFGPRGLRFDLNGDARNQVLWPPLVLNLFAFIETGMPVFLSVPGPPGYKGGQVFLNSHGGIASAVAARDFEGFEAFLVEAVGACLSHPHEWVDPQGSGGA